MYIPKLTLITIIIFFLIFSGCQKERHNPINVMSFNIRHGSANDSLDSWIYRKDNVMDIINTVSPDILGVQEALHFQVQEIDSAFEDYKYIGVGRDDGQEAGEYSAIFYDGSRLELLDQQTFWFSDTPDSIASTSWGNKITRICSWGRFKDKTSLQHFYVYNLHWDHISQNSRERGAELLMQKIGERKYVKKPFIIMGDFNAGENNPAFIKLIKNANLKLKDTFRVLYPYKTHVGTFNGYRGDSTGAKIDAILTSPEITIQAADILHNNYNGRYPSDHFPVTAVLSF